MKVLDYLRVELIARVHGYKVKVDVKNSGLLIDIYETKKRCIDFETFLRMEFDFDLTKAGFFYHTRLKDRIKFKLGLIE